MFSANDINIQGKEELQLAQVIEGLIVKLSDPQSIFGSQKFTIAKEVRNMMETMGRIKVPSNIKDEETRRINSMDYYFTILSDTIRRDLVRIIDAYAWLNRLEDKVLEVSNDIEGIPTQVNTIINKILSKARQKSILEDNIKIMDLKDPADIESGTAYHEPISGIIIPDVDETTVTENVVVSVISFRELYKNNTYESFNEDKTEILEPDTLYYDTLSEPLDIFIKMSGEEETISIIDLALNLPFKIISIESDLEGNGAMVDITDETIGRVLTMQGNPYTFPGIESSLGKDGISRFSMIFYKPQKLVEITIRVEQTDLYPTSLIELVDNHGARIKIYNPKDSMIIRGNIKDRTVETSDDVLKESKTGKIVPVLEMLPIRRVQIIEAVANTIVSITDGEVRFSSIQSESKIESIEFHVDSFDPLELIEYFIDTTRDERIPASPVNSNGVFPMRTSFAGSLPITGSLIAKLPANLDYIPIIHGVVIRTKETVI